MSSAISEKDTSKKLSPIRDELIEFILSTPVESRFHRGNRVRLYLHMPKHIDDVPQFTRAIVIGVNITTKGVRYRLAFKFDDKYLTCNRYYSEKFIGKDLDESATAKQFSTEATDEFLNSLTEAVDNKS